MHSLKDARTYSRACHTQNRIAKPNVKNKHRNSSLPCGFYVTSKTETERQTDRRTGQDAPILSPRTLPQLNKMNHDTSVSAFAFIQFNNYEQAREKSQFT